MDEHAARIRELIAGTCVASQPTPTLRETRAALLCLALDTVDREAADDACGAVHEIDATLAERLDGAAWERRRAS